MHALGKSGDPRAPDPIRNVLHDKDEYVHRASEKAIHKIEDNNAWVRQAAGTGPQSGFFYQLLENLFDIPDFIRFREPAGKTILHKILHHRIVGIPARNDRFHCGIIRF